MTRSHWSRLVRAVPPSGGNDSPVGLFSAWVLHQALCSRPRQQSEPWPGS